MEIKWKHNKTHPTQKKKKQYSIGILQEQSVTSTTKIIELSYGNFTKTYEYMKESIKQAAHDILGEKENTINKHYYYEIYEDTNRKIEE